MAMGSSVDQRVGSRLGKYAIVRRIGAGAMGDVYEGRHVELDKRVAVKTLRRDRAGDPEARARFHREGTAAARVRHPHAVEVFDVGEERDTPYLVMEFLEGEDLAAWLAREGPQSPEVIADVMLPVLAAVAAAHDEGVLHRDLKPSNIFLARTRDGELAPKVVDFGVSSIASVQQLGAVTHAHAIVGTPAYMSPEQTRGAQDLTAASDQYALGVILYECATGRLPVEPGPVLGMLMRIGQGNFPPPRQVRPALSAAFEAVVLRAMALDVGQRYEGVREMGRALLAFAGERARVNWRNVFEARASTAPRVSGGDGVGARPGRTTLGSSVRERAVSAGRRVDARVWMTAAAVAVGALGAWAGMARAGRGGAARYEVVMTAQPAGARFVVDGAEAGAGAMRRVFAADGAQHVVTVSAPGYAPREVVFVDAPPTTTQVTLEARAAVVPVVRAAPVVQAAPAVQVAPRDARGAPRRRAGERPAPRAPTTGPRTPMGTNGIGVL